MIKIDNFEILKEIKIIYEYTNDLIENSDLKNIKKNEHYLLKMKELMSDVYYDTYKEMEKTIENRKLLTSCNCPKCSSFVKISDLIDYEYVCTDCDENFYWPEGDIGKQWYLSNNDRQYYIKIWETENDRECGIAFNFTEEYKLKNEAISTAKELIDRENYAYVEVINKETENIIYGTDGYVEDFYGFKNNNVPFIYKVNVAFLNNYMENWFKKQKSNIDSDLIYCEDGNKFIAIDNSSGYCYTEEFYNEKEAILWLMSELDIEDEKFKNINKDLKKYVKDFSSEYDDLILS